MEPKNINMHRELMLRPKAVLAERIIELTRIANKETARADRLRAPMSEQVRDVLAYITPGLAFHIKPTIAELEAKLDTYVQEVDTFMTPSKEERRVNACFRILYNYITGEQ